MLIAKNLLTREASYKFSVHTGAVRRFENVGNISAHERMSTTSSIHAHVNLRSHGRPRTARGDIEGRRGSLV